MTFARITAYVDVLETEVLTASQTVAIVRQLRDALAGLQAALAPYSDDGNWQGCGGCHAWGRSWHDGEPRDPDGNEINNPAAYMRRLLSQED